MKIVYITHRYYPDFGGVEYVVKSIAERLKSLGHNITVITSHKNSRNIVSETINGVKIVRWPSLVINNAYYIPLGPNKLIEKLKNLLENADIVHVHNAHAVFPVYLGLMIRRHFPKTKLVFTLHYHGEASSLVRDIMMRTLWRKYVKKLINYAEIIHAVSYVEASHILLHYPEAKHKLIIIPNGVDEDVMRYRWRGIHGDYILYAGRIERYKKLETAIDLISLINDYGYKIKLLIVGHGSYKYRLIKYIQKKAVNNVIIMPPQPREIYLKLIANALASINPSDKEAFSLFIAESLSIGTPVIVSKTIARIYKIYTKNTAIPDLQWVLPIVRRLNLIMLVNSNYNPLFTWNNIINKYLNKIYN